MAMTHSYLTGGRHTGVLSQTQHVHRCFPIRWSSKAHSIYITSLTVGRRGAVGHMRRGKRHSLYSDALTLHALYIEKKLVWKTLTLRLELFKIGILRYHQLVASSSCTFRISACLLSGFAVMVRATKQNTKNSTPACGK
jgi:hypothetical protein